MARCASPRASFQQAIPWFAWANSARKLRAAWAAHLGAGGCIFSDGGIPGRGRLALQHALASARAQTVSWFGHAGLQAGGCSAAGRGSRWLRRCIMAVANRAVWAFLRAPQGGGAASRVTRWHWQPICTPACRPSSVASRTCRRAACQHASVRAARMCCRAAVPRGHRLPRRWLAWRGPAVPGDNHAVPMTGCIRRWLSCCLPSSQARPLVIAGESYAGELGPACFELGRSAAGGGSLVARQTLPRCY